MNDNKILEDELMTDDELDKVAGGVISAEEQALYDDMVSSMKNNENNFKNTPSCKELTEVLKGRA